MVVDVVNASHTAHPRLFLPPFAQVEIDTKELDSDMYRTCLEPMLASMGMQKAVLYNACGI